MPSVINLHSVQDTTLWKKLNSGFTGEDETVAKVLASNLIGICDEASNRMKSFPTLHSQYTLHDEVHLLRVTELMALLLPEQVLNILNPVEVALMILSAFFHDQGMILSSAEIANLDTNSEFQLFKNNWIIEHPNIKEIRQRLLDRNLSHEEKERCSRADCELLDALLTDYIRRIHGERSANFVRTQYSQDKRWEVCGVNLSNITAKICLSHTQPALSLSPANGYNYDESVGTYLVNVPFIAILLRLADILDFDRDRTPDSLYRTIHFTNSVSVAEWEKHRSVEGWVITPELIRFTMRCEHPIYERAARHYMDWIDEELSNAYMVLRNFPHNVQKYYIDIPLRVDRSRIEAKDGNYIYHDLEFSLSRDEIVKLLMTDNLYQSPSLCIRELLQNALDALRHRKALIKRDLGIEWDKGKVQFEHSVNEYGYEVVTCIDNGVGMDEHIITRYLTNAGKSYYRSPEFSQERATFNSSGADFEPCAQFGIGFMSCFMIGDNITIYTRKDYGQNRGYGEPLIVEINGLSGIVIIRKGSYDQPIGTTIKIVGRKKPDYIDEWEDKVKLIEVINGYALACEFPIEAHCRIPEIADSIIIPPNISVPKTIMEKNNIKHCITFEQKFADINPYLNGCIRASFLTNETGKLTLSNDEASWKPSEKDYKPKLVSLTGQELEMHYFWEENQTCLDGILVCGCPGRDKECHRLGMRGNVIHLGEESFILDIRGLIKPSLTPERVPPRRSFDYDPAWKRIQRMASLAQGRLWEQVLLSLDHEPNSELFWQLATIYGFWVPWLRSGEIWDNIMVPLISEGNSVEWRRISELGKIIPSRSDISYEFSTLDHMTVSPDDNLTKWEAVSYGRRITSNINCTVLGMSNIKLEEDKIILELKEPDNYDNAPWEHTLDMTLGAMPLLPFVGQIKECLSIQSPFRCANINHPLVKLALESQYVNQRNEIEELARSVVICLSDSDTLKLLGTKDKQVNHLMYRLGHLYNAIDWTKYASELAPPYKVWLDTIGYTIITAEDFQLWAKTKPKRL